MSRLGKNAPEINKELSKVQKTPLQILGVLVAGVQASDAENDQSEDGDRQQPAGVETCSVCVNREDGVRRRGGSFLASLTEPREEEGDLWSKVLLDLVDRLTLEQAAPRSPPVIQTLSPFLGQFVFLFGKVDAAL